MMNKTEQEIYDRALRCEKILKDEIDILQRKINSVLGFCNVIAKDLLDRYIKSKKPEQEIIFYNVEPGTGLWLSL